MRQAGSTPPAALTTVAAKVEARLVDLFHRELTRWEAVDRDLKEPLQSLQQVVLAGGKRLRPAFCFWAFVGVGGDPTDDRVIDAGAALELLHISALVHDDVIDASRTRHGIEAAHVDFARHHTDAQWRGEADRFGEGMAILTGDLAAAYADTLLSAPGHQAREVFDELRIELNVGQLLDLIASVQGDVTLERARLIARYKSGKYTIERPLHLGAALAEPSRLEELTGPLTAYGLPLGEAFQLRDDILGVFGDGTVTGKPVGEDLREGKPTMLYALAWERARGPAARLLAQRFGRADLRSDEVETLQAVFQDTGALTEVEAAIDSLVEEALAAAANLPLNGEARNALVDLAVFVAGRRY
ncbi:MAG TPA: polyprenyl synthetase family protein [Acidimicrobiales bacterium]